MLIQLFRYALSAIITLLMLQPLKSAMADTLTVFVFNNQFSLNGPGNPVVSNATILEGDYIRWEWLQGNHTTTSVMGISEMWDQPLNSSNVSYTRVFNTAGTFWYYCTPHGSDNMDGTASGMAGSIQVLPSGTGACCLPDGSCINTDAGFCASEGGTFSGVGSNCATTACQYTVEIVATQDNVLYQSATGTISNALGSHLFAGNNTSGVRRPILSFDLTGIPSNAQIDAAQLRLYCTSNSGEGFPMTLHEVLESWTEGSSIAGGNETSGTTALLGDVTWLHRTYNTLLWSQPGGSFNSESLTSTIVNAQNQSFIWTSEALRQVVEHWVHMPMMNRGLLLKGNESATNNTKRFATLHVATVSQRPTLLVTYSIQPSGACCLADGSCSDLTPMQCSMAGGSYQGDGSLCSTSSCPVSLTPFIDPLPIPGVAAPTTGVAGGAAHYDMYITEQFQTLHSQLPPTRVWGYNGSYPGPTIEAFRDQLVTVQWHNDLRVAETGELRTTHAMFVDTCMHGPNMTGQAPVTVTHLHGGKVDPISDGPPEEVFGPGQSSVVYEYPNIQPAGTLWYHDHALGITRLNVMMGLAGLYYIRDNEEVALQLPSGEYEIPLVIQDKSFGQDGSILYPEKHQDHFFGDVLMVNGKVWPYLEVKRGKYRFRLINGSNSRTYSLALSNGASFYQIGSELGLIDAPLLLNELTIHPGERYDVVMDFGVYAPGTEITLTNSAPAPFPGFPGVGVVPEVMKFLVQADPGYTNALPLTLVAVPPMDTSLAVMERVFELVTIPDHGCGDDHGHGAGVMWTINGLMWDDITEFPEEDSYEIWTWHNESGMSHPMHMHLVAFQILHRQAIDESTGLPIGPLLAPEPHERGWKDTGHSPTGFRTAVMAQFSGFTGTYPYHCHILEHEDHEMMRQFTVVPANPGCTINGGVLGASENRSFCVGTGTSATLAVTVTDASGTNARWALIDSLGNIVETRSSNSLFNLDNKAPGDYTIRYLRYENDVTNLGTITNISQIGTLNGCYSVASNAITVFLRPEPLGGILTALTPTTVCANAGAATSVQLAIAGNTGEFSRFGITSPALGQQLVATSSTGSFNLNGLAPGSYTAAHLSYQRGVNASAVNFPNELRGCFAISNTLPLTLLDCSVAKLENAPNPSKGLSEVVFSLPFGGRAELMLYDFKGQLIKHLFSDEVIRDHEYLFEFDGSHLPDGVYLYRLSTDTQVLTSKFIITR